MYYEFKTGKYHGEVRSKHSEDTQFTLRWKWRTPMEDDYEMRVAKGSNTLIRLSGEAARAIEKKLASLGTFQVNINVSAAEADKVFPLDIPYAEGLLDTSSLMISQVSDQADAEKAAALARSIFQTLQQAGHEIRNIDLYFTKPDYAVRYGVIKLSREDAFRDDLVQRLRKLEQDFRNDPQRALMTDQLRVMLEQ